MRLTLGLLTAILSSGMAMAATPSPTMTMAQANKLSDEALTRQVLWLFDHTPQFAETRPGGFAGLAAETVRIQRPPGYMLPSATPVGFNFLTLVLRAKPTAVSSALCEQPRMTLLLDSTMRADIFTPDPPAKAVGVEEGRKFVPLAPSASGGRTLQSCTDLPPRAEGLEAIDAATAWTGLQLFDIVKRQAAQGGKLPWLSCAEDLTSPQDGSSETACRKALTAARRDRIVLIQGCETETDDDGAPVPGEHCLTVSGIRYRTMMSGENWIAHIVYRPGAQPAVTRVLMEIRGYVI